MDCILYDKATEIQTKTQITNNFTKQHDSPKELFG